ncbi:hypothetical protein ABID21_000476 [Pseudorhizobium tarimense]|uniref:Glyoxalase/fosfomycin resistance/dioxygenase domain-containing protein n=1 Tax=Pseudorhizobium tarimense TaxID=1079109 RepID=A0ABV2H1I2_9HYPH
MTTDIINHVEFPVTEVERARRFYEAVLAPLGLTLVISIDPDRTPHGAARHGFGKNGYPSLWIHQKSGERLPIHLASTAGDRATVDAFHAAALANGGTDNGAPGIRSAIMTTITQPMCSIPTATISKPSARGLETSPARRLTRPSVISAKDQ